LSYVGGDLFGYSCFENIRLEDIELPEEIMKLFLGQVCARAIDVRLLVTRKMMLEEIKEAFEILSTAKSEIKIAITPY